MSNQQQPENALILTPRQEHLQRIRDEMAPGAEPGPIVPRTFAEVMTMCQALAAATIAPKHLRGNPVEMAMVVMTGLEVGLPPMASLRLYTTWDGVPRLMAEGVRGIILMRAHTIEYFEMATCDDNHATWIGKRRGRPEKSVTWTIERAKRAGLLNKENWQKYPQDMLNARASMQLGRIIAPDVVAGMVALEEARDGDFIDVQGTEAKPQFVAPPPPQGPPPGVPVTMSVDGKPVLSTTVHSVTVTDTGTKPTAPKRGPGRPPGSKNAERPTPPASSSPPSASPGTSSSPASSGSASTPAAAASAPASEASGTSSSSSADPTSGGSSSGEATSPPPSETTSAASTPADDGFGGEDPEDSQPAPTGDPGLALIAEFQKFLAGCKDQKEMQAGRPPFAQRSAALFREGDQRFAAPGNGKPAGELAARMGQLWAERKSQVPA